MLKTAAMVVVVAVVMTMNSGRASDSVSGSVDQWVSGTTHDRSRGRGGDTCTIHRWL